jgi:hypothetical protein
VPLGHDRRTAIAQLPAALVMIDATFNDAARSLGGSVSGSPTPSAPMDAGALARAHCAQRLAQDAAARSRGPLWASIGVNDEYVVALRAVLAGRMPDQEVEILLGETMREFEQRDDGPLFHSRHANPAKLPGRAVAGRLSTWLRREGLTPAGVAPNHGWRHRFKSQSMDLALNPRVIDDIQGHTGRTAQMAMGR